MLPCNGQDRLQPPFDARLGSFQKTGGRSPLNDAPLACAIFFPQTRLIVDVEATMTPAVEQKIRCASAASTISENTSDRLLHLAELHPGAASAPAGI